MMLLTLALFCNTIAALPLNKDLPQSDDSVRLSMIFLIVFISCITFLLLSLIIFWVVIRKLRFKSDDELLLEQENQAYLVLNSDEQELYFQSQDYLTNNPHVLGDLQLLANLLIQEKGINAFEFVKDSMLTNSDLIIINKSELNFFKNFECSVQTNLPIPMKNEVYYFECKIYSYTPTDSSIISLGLGIKPYPWFRLPGRHQHSVSYDSDGYRRHNQPFPFDGIPPFPKFIEGDVIGIGYRVRSGTIFFTRNGKKINEAKVGGHVKNFKIGGAQVAQLYPIIGANCLCSIHVNMGQAGFVFIEGNVKKWGFAPLEGNGPSPPAYNKFNGDILLERSEIDDSDISDREHDFPPDFWDVNDNNPPTNNAINNDKFLYNAYSEVDPNEEQITLNSLVISNKPPSYDGEGNEVSTIEQESLATGTGGQTADEPEDMETEAHEDTDATEGYEAAVEDINENDESVETSTPIEASTPTETSTPTEPSGSKTSDVTEPIETTESNPSSQPNESNEINDPETASNNRDQANQ